jgi:hypothetical protein
MEPDGSFPYSQVPATCPYPEPTPSSPHNPLQIPEDPSQYYPPIYIWVSHPYIQKYGYVLKFSKQKTPDDSKVQRSLQN